MKLSEAIRLGAMLRPQEFQLLFAEHDGEWCSCALGAAGEAIGIQPNDDNKGLGAVLAVFPLTAEVAMHPVNGMYQSVWSIIANLNNRHHWTRERIADWVEQVELTLEPKGAPDETEHAHARVEPVGSAVGEAATSVAVVKRLERCTGL